jgi:hypothetical protein
MNKNLLISIVIIAVFGRRCQLGLNKNPLVRQGRKLRCFFNKGKRTRAVLLLQFYYIRTIQFLSTLFCLFR